MKPNRHLTVAWCVQLIVLVASAAWSFFDPLFLSTVNATPSLPEWNSRNVDPIRSLLVFTFPLAALVSLVWIAVQPWRRSASGGRTIKSMLAVTAVIGLWCGLAVQHRNLAWQGKRVRLASQLDQFRELSETLKDDFPREDGTLSSLGPFMAYPIGRPTVLILLTPPSVSRTGTTVSAIEKLDNGLAFQLSGIDGGDWVQWHPESQQPTSFVGGLSDIQTMRSSLRLAKNWYLVRYEASHQALQSLPLQSSTKSRATSLYIPAESPPPATEEPPIRMTERDGPLANHVLFAIFRVRYRLC